MNIETYREIFHYVTFPVFAVSENGVLIYKNLACARYLPQIYKSRTVKTRISPEIPKVSAPVHIWGGSSYSVALALRDGENVVFLCLSRFQYEDGISIANRFLQIFGNNLLDFLSGFRKQVSSAEYRSFDFGFSDEELLTLVNEEFIFWKSRNTSLVEVLSPVFKKMNEFFVPLGYDILAKIENTSLEYLPLRISIGDLFFLLGKLIYFTMKFSDTHRLEIVLFPEFAYSRQILRLMTKTRLKELPQTEGNNMLLLKKLMPECAAELELLERTGFLKNTDFSIYLDRVGTMTITYRFPYPEPVFPSFQSVDTDDPTILGNIEIMIQSIWAKLRDTDASCL